MSTGLIALTKHTLKQDPLSGHLYIYVNRRGDYLKALYWDRSGFCLWAKRLERGRFISNWQQARDLELDVTGLKLLLEGIEPARSESPGSVPLSTSIGLASRSL